MIDLSNPTNILILMGALILGFLTGLLAYVYYLHRKFKSFFRQTGADFQGMVETHMEDLEKQKEEIKRIKEHISKLREISKVSFQKYAMVRFNPFQEVGSDQSFCIALLDAENNGFVMTSHFGRDFNKIYSKPVVAGRSDYSLSKEEEVVIAKAVKASNNAFVGDVLLEEKSENPQDNLTTGESAKPLTSFAERKTRKKVSIKKKGKSTDDTPEESK